MTDLLPAWALGGAAIGNLYTAVSDADAAATVAAALESGLGLIDTAPYYGASLSETRIGQALAAWRGARPMISSKVGRVLDPVAPHEAGGFGYVETPPLRPRFDYSRDGVWRSLEGSLQRLDVAKLDIAFVHDIGATTHHDKHPALMQRMLDETIPALIDARAQGLLDRFGIGVNEWEVCAEAMERGAPLDAVLLAGRYTVLEQPALTSGMLALAEARGVRVLAAGVFNSGLLATRPAAGSTYNYAPAQADVIARAERFWETCTRFGVAPQAVAAQFPQAHPAIACVVVGARSADEIADLARWRAEVIPEALWAALKRDGFIAAEAPTPKGNA